tara:strand:+ start:2127 stop:2411 length:285 start_codon:yes stop_codon:yes gene_type:complete
MSIEFQERTDTEALPFSDRLYLVMESLKMVEEGLEILYQEALDEGHDDNELLEDSLMEMRETAFMTVLRSHTNGRTEIRQMVKAVAIEVGEDLE